MERHEWAWLAGLFEGEGTIGFPHTNGVQLRIGMTDRDTIETVHRLYPTTGLRTIEVKNRKKPLYIWQASSRDSVRAFLVGVMPYLHSRRHARATEALKRLENNTGAKYLRTHCPAGHPLSGANVYRKPYNGTRSCQACRDRRDRERAERRRAERRAAQESQL